MRLYAVVCGCVGLCAVVSIVCIVYIVRAVLITCVKNDTGLSSTSEVPMTSKYPQKILKMILKRWQFG